MQEEIDILSIEPTEGCLISLRNRKNKQIVKIKRLRKIRNIFICQVILTPYCLIIFILLFKLNFIFGPIYVTASLLYVIASITFMFVFSMQLRQANEELQDIDFEIDLLKYSASPQERRAEKLLHISNIQLRRYYSLNLSQNIWIFCLGIFCIFIGVAVIGVTFYLLLQIANDTETKIISAVLGSIGSLLVNYVAVIYLKIHAKAASNLSLFHSRLVETNQMLLANLLASHIDDEARRWNTISQLSINVGKKIGED